MCCSALLLPASAGVSKAEIAVSGEDRSSVGAALPRQPSYLRQTARSHFDEKALGAAGGAVDLDGEVEVGAAAVAGRGAVHEVLADRDAVTGGDGVASGEAVAVGVLGSVVAIHDDADAAPAAGGGRDHDAVGHCVERGASRDRDVGGGVVVVRLGEPLRVFVVPAPLDR